MVRAAAFFERALSLEKAISICLDSERERNHVRQRKTQTAEEFEWASRQFGAEGAPAPETLRQMDRNLMTLWKVVVRLGVPAHRR